jgi:hypothetical protein
VSRRWRSVEPTNDEIRYFSMVAVMPRECMDVVRGTHLGQRSVHRVEGRTHDRIRTDTGFCTLGLEPTGPFSNRAFYVNGF